MLNWLTGNWEFFGLDGQNWMWLTGCGFLVYIATLLLTRRREHLP